MFDKYINKTTGENPYSQSVSATPALNTTPPLNKTPSMIDKYINQVNHPAGLALNNKSKEKVDYSAVPAPIMTNPAVTSKVNAALFDADQAIKEAESILGT